MADVTGTETGDSTGSAQLRAFIASQDAPCPVCGYSLRGLTEPRCPECGAPLILQVGSPQLRVGGWALAIVSFALALGFDGVVSLLMTVAMIIAFISGDAGFQWQPIGIATGFVLLASAMLGCLIGTARRRHAWQRKPVRTQWLWGGLVFAAVGVSHLLVGVGFIAMVGA